MTDYVELHAHSFFSLKDGASSPEALVDTAAQIGMDTLALTDHDALYGAPRFSDAATAIGVRPIFGAELTVEDTHLTLLVENAQGWTNLCQLITTAQANAPKGYGLLPQTALEGQTTGLIALSGCRRGAVAQSLLRRDEAAALAAAQQYQTLFGRERYFIELQHHLLPDDPALIAALSEVAQRTGIETVATNNVHYATQKRHALQDVQVCIRQLTPLDENTHLRPNSEYFLKSAQQMQRLFARSPQALAATRRIADRCRYALQGGLQTLPAFPTPNRQSAEAYLRELCIEGAHWRFGELSERVHHQLDYELKVLVRAGLSNYFLILWDIVRWSNEQGIACQGRGSAANSLVAYVLGISPVDPLAHDLVFERFLSAERQVTPDVDIDFDAARREEVIQYVYRRYGRDHAAMACTYLCFRARSAIRDVGKALGLSQELVAQAARTVSSYGTRGLREAEALQELLGGETNVPVFEHLLDLCEQIDDTPRDLGIHSGAMILTGQPLWERIPVEPATKADRTVVQWDKDGLERAGIVKIDLLGLRMLAAVSEATRLVEAKTGKPLLLERLRYDDPNVYQNIINADTIGEFQVESRAQMTVLPRMKPTCFADLVIVISLIRPGPIIGNMVHPYLRRRAGEEPVTYLHPLLEPALKETLGVILFQEQVLKVARDVAGFTPGQGELLRRALGAKRATEAIDRLRATFIEGAFGKGVPLEIAEQIFEALRAFGSYSFAKSHAAAFASLVYRSAWLKVYHAKEFYTALLNNQPMGFWAPAILVNDARRRNVPVLPPDIHRSATRCTVEGKDIRIGLHYVKGLGESASDRIIREREQRPFADLKEFCRRTRLSKRLVEHLIRAGTLDNFGERRQLLWQLGTLAYSETVLGLQFDEEAAPLVPMSEDELALAEWQMLGLCLRAHPLEKYRQTLRRQSVQDSASLRQIANGARLRVAGLLVVHQSPPTAHGVHFLTLEDEFGLMDIIVFPDQYERFWRTIRGTSLFLIDGILQHEGGVTNVLAGNILPLDPRNHPTRNASSKRRR